jgi:hypothetical protein
MLSQLQSTAACQLLPQVAIATLHTAIAARNNPFVHNMNDHDVCIADLDVCAREYAVVDAIEPVYQLKTVCCERQQRRC